MTEKRTVIDFGLAVEYNLLRESTTRTNRLVQESFTTIDIGSDYSTTDDKQENTPANVGSGHIPLQE